MARGVLASVLIVAVAPAAAAPGVVIPWLDEHPVKASVRPLLAPPCRSVELRAHLFLQGATGSLVGGIRLTNTSTTACSLLGWPHVSFTGQAAGATRWQVKRIAASPEPLDMLADPPGSLRALAPGKSAGLSLFWSNWCGPGSHPAGGSGTPPNGVKVSLTSGTSLIVPLVHAPRCDAPQYPSKLLVSPFAPAVRQLPPSSRLPLAVAIVGPRPVRVKPGLRAFRARRGQLLRYRVAVTNTGNVPYRFPRSSCPVYIQSFSPSSPQAYVLNCRPVSAIAPHGSVLFEMRITVPAAARLGNTSLTWELAPKTYEAPFAPAAVWVRP